MFGCSLIQYFWSFRFGRIVGLVIIDVYLCIACLVC